MKMKIRWQNQNELETKNTYNDLEKSRKKKQICRQNDNGVEKDKTYHDPEKKIMKVQISWLKCSFEKIICTNILCSNIESTEFVTT